MSAKDYAKPIGYWCPACKPGVVFRGNGEVYGLTHESHCMIANAIPVFEPLPADKREEAAPPEDDDVVDYIANDGTPFIERFGNRSLSLPEEGQSRSLRWAWHGGPHSLLRDTDWRLCFVCCGTPQTTPSRADAVLWVVEGGE